MSDLLDRLGAIAVMDLRTGPIPAHTIDTVGEARAEIARLRAKIERHEAARDATIRVLSDNRFPHQTRVNDALGILSRS